jgi:hypothetical protein
MIVSIPNPSHLPAFYNISSTIYLPSAAAILIIIAFQTFSSKWPEHNPMATDPPAYSAPSNGHLGQIISTWSLESRVMINIMRMTSAKITAVQTDVIKVKNDIANMKSELKNITTGFLQVKLQAVIAGDTTKDACKSLEVIEVVVEKMCRDLGTSINAVVRRLDSKVSLAILDNHTNIIIEFSNFKKQGSNADIPPPNINID